KIDQVRNILHERTQQSAFLGNLLDQFEVNQSSIDLSLQLERLPRLGDIGENLTTIHRFGKRTDVGIAGHHDTGGVGNFSRAPQNFVPRDSRHALIAKNYREVMFPRQKQRRFRVGSCKYLVIVLEKVLQRLEY